MSMAMSADVPRVARSHTIDHYRADIDGLRAVAVLAVIGYHAFPEFFPGGFVGVDVFFVISGFLISGIILRNLRLSTFTFTGFYSNRIRRIFPALVIVLAACLLFGWFALLPDEFERLGKHIAAAATFVSNFALWQESGYFDAAAELKPLLHLWSLGIEEQFYLAWPLVLFLLWRARLNIAVVVLLLTAASFAVSVSLGQQRPVANFYFPFSRFWELGLGCLLAVMKESPGAFPLWTRTGLPLQRFRWMHAVSTSWPVVAGLGLICAAVFLFDRRTPFPGWAALVPTIGAVCVIGASGNCWIRRRILASSFMVLVGLISYPLYLWHWPLLSFTTILEAGRPHHGVRSLAVLLGFVLAWLTYRFIERPIRAQRGTPVTFGLVGGLLVFGGAGLIAFATSGFMHRFDHEVRAIQPVARTNPACIDGFTGQRGFNYCKSTSRELPEVVFLGDSQAHAIYEGVAAGIGDRHPMTLLARGGCPPLLDVPGGNGRGCNDMWKTFVEYVRDAGASVVVVVGGGAPLLQGPAAAQTVRGMPFPVTAAVYKQGLRTLIDALQESSDVIYVREIPRFQSAPACFLRPIRLPWSHCAPRIRRDRVEEKMASYNRVVDELVDELPELQVVDSIPALCGSQLCSQRLKSGEILYSDKLHLSSAGGRYFARTSGLQATVLRQVDMSTD